MIVKSRRLCNPKRSPRINGRHVKVYDSLQEKTLKKSKNENPSKTRKKINSQEKSICDIKENTIDEKKSVAKNEESESNKLETSLEKSLNLYDFLSSQSEDEKIPLNESEISHKIVVSTPLSLHQNRFISKKFYGNKSTDSPGKFKCVSEKSSCKIKKRKSHQMDSENTKNDRMTSKKVKLGDSSDVLSKELDKITVKIIETSTPKYALKKESKLNSKKKSKPQPCWKPFRLDKESAKKMKKHSHTDDSLKLNIKSDYEKQQFKETARSILATLNQSRNFADSDGDSSKENIVPHENWYAVKTVKSQNEKITHVDSGIFDMTPTPIKSPNENDNNCISTPSILLARTDNSLDFGYGSFLETPAFSPVKTVLPASPFKYHNSFIDEDYSSEVETPLSNRSYSKITMIGLDFQEKKKRKKKGGRYSTNKIDIWADQFNADLDDAANFELTVEG